MILTFKELQALKSKEVFIRRPYTGWVTFTVTECTDTYIAFKSTSLGGFDFKFCGDDAINDFEYYASVQAICTNMKEAIRFDTDRTDATIAEYVDRYKEDKEGFIKEMIRQTYKKIYRC